MYATGLSDLDALVLQCRDGKARSYLAEAVKCLKAGAFRAAIVVTWVAVVHDLIAKLEQLALAGDKNAQAKVDHFRRTVASGDVKASLEFERTILDSARDEFEFFGHLAHVDLLRLRDDRNRCAHPSMIDPETDYQPAPELARCHAVNAVVHLLEHGPAQGKAALDRLLAELDQNYFPASVAELVVHLEHGPLGRPRTSLVRNYLLVLLKRYFSGPPEATSSGPLDLRARLALGKTNRRIARTVQAVVEMHREIAVATLDEKLDEIVAQTPETHLGALIVLAAAAPDAWNALSQAQQNRAVRYVRAMPTADFARCLGAAWCIPDLQSAAQQRILSGSNWTAVAKVPEPPFAWIEMAVAQMIAATSWGEANAPKDFLSQHADRLLEQQIQGLLEAAKENESLRSSWGLKDTLWALSQRDDVGPIRLKAWVEQAGLDATYSPETWWPKDATPEE